LDDAGGGRDAPQPKMEWRGGIFLGRTKRKENKRKMKEGKIDKGKRRLQIVHNKERLTG
jgi:hypothetical protein